jgi:hypothetical protein
VAASTGLTSVSRRSEPSPHIACEHAALVARAASPASRSPGRRRRCCTVDRLRARSTPWQLSSTRRRPALCASTGCPESSLALFTRARCCGPAGRLHRRRIVPLRRHRDALPDRLDHQDVHRDGDHAAPRRGPPAVGRPVVEHGPELRTAGSPFGAIETVTIRRLLSHESGLMGDPPGTDWSGAGVRGRRGGEPRRRRPRSRPPCRPTRSRSTRTSASNCWTRSLRGCRARRRPTVRDDDPRPARPRLDVVRAAVLRARDPRRDWLRRPWVQRRPSAVAGDGPKRGRGSLWPCVADLARWISAQFTEDVLRAATWAEMHRPRDLGNAAWTPAKGSTGTPCAASRGSGFSTRAGFTVSPATYASIKRRSGRSCPSMATRRRPPSAWTLPKPDGGRRNRGRSSHRPRFRPSGETCWGLYADPDYACSSASSGATATQSAGRRRERVAAHPGGDADARPVRGSPGVPESGEQCAFHSTETSLRGCRSSHGPEGAHGCPSCQQRDRSFLRPSPHAAPSLASCMPVSSRAGRL